MVKPSALPQTLLTVSFIYLLSIILTGALVDVVIIVVCDAKGYASKISAGFSDDYEQSQLERMLKPAIARVILLPGLLMMI